MDVLGSAGQLELSLSRTQMDEERQVRALASGLRVISASDDPSGLAISENIQTKVLGLQQGVQNVQTANNLLNVADSALASVQSILSRIHSLVVEATNDFNSVSQLNSIQEEIDQLLHEINKIAGSANFNGLKLLDGSLSMTASPVPTVTPIQSLPLPNGTPVTGSNVVNWDGSGTPGPLVLSYIDTTAPPTVPTVGALPAYISVRVTGYSANAVDPDTGTAVGAGDYVQFVAYSNSPQMGAAPLYMDTIAVPINSPGLYTGIQTTPPTSPGSILLEWSLPNLTPQDVGASATFETSSPNSSTPSNGSPLSVNSSGQEGGDVHISLPSVSTSALNLSGINVLPTQYMDYTGNVVGTTGNAVPAADAEARVQMALDAISGVRATVGAQSVSLQEDASDASLEVVNQVASESAIRDVDMGQAAVQLTKDQILSHVGVSVLAQMQQNAQLIIHLVGAVNPGTQGLI